MGQDWRPNRAFYLKFLLRILNLAQDKYERAKNIEIKHAWGIFKLYANVCYIISLRGNEALLIDLAGIIKYNTEDRDHVIITILGKVKGESQNINHLVPSVCITNSGINVKNTIMQAIDLKKCLGFNTGPVISDSKGIMRTTKSLDEQLWLLLEEIFDGSKKLFRADITSHEHIREHYKVFRSFRRTSNTQALEEGVSGPDIDLINR